MRRAIEHEIEEKLADVAEVAGYDPAGSIAKLAASVVTRW
jgi:hypothetical protein